MFVKFVVIWYQLNGPISHMSILLGMGQSFNSEYTCEADIYWFTVAEWRRMATWIWINVSFEVMAYSLAALKIYPYQCIIKYFLGNSHVINYADTL